MTITVKVLLAYLIAALLVFCWLFRYGVTPYATTTGVSVVDRWAGKVYFCASRCVQQFPPD